MKQSHLFTKTRKEAPKDEVSKNAQLLIRAGYIHKEMAGVYSYLPLGLRVLENIKRIVREEMDAIGSQEIIMTALQRKELWEKTDRWNDQNVDVWFKSKLKNETEVGFGWSHEEPITDMMRSFVTSFRDLPIFVYQFQTKLRNEVRAKSGIMRGREFLMKDLYSYTVDEKSHQEFYNKVIQAYVNIFKRVGIGDDTFMTFASGGAFTEFSHEFQTITEGGEDTIYINREKNIAINEEILNDETLSKLGVTKDELEKVQTSEVGNIFNFGTKKPEQLGLYYTDADSKKIPVWLGSYGIGITRLMGVIVEKFADEKGIAWPKHVGPFKFHLIALPGKTDMVLKTADALYEKMIQQKISVLYDDRDMRPGEKFADADLIGITHRLIISEKTIEAGNLEYKNRITGEIKMINESDIPNITHNPK
jgi:prolyl-tRNA synthetase